MKHPCYKTLLFYIFLLVTTRSPVTDAAPLKSLFSGIDQALTDNQYQPRIIREWIVHQRGFVDQIYEKGSSAILVKFGIRDNKPEQPRRLISHPKGFFYQDRNEDGLTFSLFFYQISESQARSLLLAIDSSHTTHLHWIHQLLIPKASAKEAQCQNEETPEILNFGRELDQKFLTEITMTCSSAAGSGAQTKLNENLELLDPTNLPSVNLSAFWDEAVKSYEAIRELIPQLAPMMDELSEVLAQFHPKLKLNVICAAIGSQTVEYLTPGGVVKKLILLKSKIAGLNKLIAILRSLSKLYNKHSNSKWLDKATRRIGACSL
jgi:hypothetical protein